MAEQEPQQSVPLALPLPWQESLWQTFISRLDQNRLPHAMMLTGATGIGVERIAAALAQRLLCTAELSKYACGSCKGCQLIMAGNHPDLSTLEPAEEGKAILIDQVRDLMARLSKTAQQGGWKVALISPAETMNINASNALLKSLEEPQGKTLLILLSYRPSLVSATIRSRCQVQSLPLPDQAQASRWLAEVSGDAQLAEQTLDIAGGRPLLALDYMQGDSLQQRQAFEGTVEQVRRGDLSPVDAAQQCHRQNSDQLLDWFMNYLHRLATGELQNSPNPALFDFSDKLRTARSWVLSGSNINPQLLWEELFMDWLQVFRRRGG
ncbi:DNA polymerase III subunit delta' [Porticoccaceae bacterium]|jgi:DNA polymerase-3 subunit delta'|nr:DNA polymerase III subunit delta' [Porticoccaceae bacterium]MDA9918697.1 DNA polymerase III subunit delta' [Porticoccaceae bacterium]MDB3967039.1 DNA polymerase III subunit delta' [Porticoccaceae bacterium]